MSTYIYTFILNNKEQEVEACNLFTGAKKLGIEITRAERHSHYYLSSTPFDKRERYVWSGMKLYQVKQRRKDLFIN